MLYSFLLAVPNTEIPDITEWHHSLPTHQWGHGRELAKSEIMKGRVGHREVVSVFLDPLLGGLGGEVRPFEQDCLDIARVCHCPLRRFVF